MITDTENLSTCRSICPSVALYPANSSRAALEVNPYVRKMFECSKPIFGNDLFDFSALTRYI